MSVLAKVADLTRATFEWLDAVAPSDATQEDLDLMAQKIVARRSSATIKAKARMIRAWERMNGRRMTDAEKRARGF